MLTLHIYSVLFSLVIVFIADKDALAWLRGKKKILNPKRVRVLHTLTWCGLLALTITGGILMYPMLGYLLTQPLFIIKLLFVAILFINAILIGRFSHIAITQPYAELSFDRRLALFTSGAISSFSWAAALVLALVVFK